MQDDDLLAPIILLNVPNGQGWQDEEVLAPTDKLNVPLGQCEQIVAPDILL